MLTYKQLRFEANIFISKKVSRVWIYGIKIFQFSYKKTRWENGESYLLPLPIVFILTWITIQLSGVR